MKCPLVCAYLARLVADLDRSTISQDLIDEARELWEDPKNTDAQMASRIAFCCDAALRFIVAEMLGEKKPDTFSIWKQAIDDNMVAYWSDALGPVLTYYGIEVAEAKMGVGERGSAQLQQSKDARQLNQVIRVFKLLEASTQRNVPAVRDLFYSILYAAQEDSEARVAMAHMLLEVHAA